MHCHKATLNLNIVEHKHNLFGAKLEYSAEYDQYQCCKNSVSLCHQGAVSIRKTVLPGMAIPILKIRRPNGRLIFNMEIAIRR